MSLVLGIMDKQLFTAKPKLKFLTKYCNVKIALTLWTICVC